MLLVFDVFILNYVRVNLEDKIKLLQYVSRKDNISVPNYVNINLKDNIVVFHFKGT
jgi:hypothetical protein